MARWHCKNANSVKAQLSNRKPASLSRSISPEKMIGNKNHLDKYQDLEFLKNHKYAKEFKESKEERKKQLNKIKEKEHQEKQKPN